MRILFRIAAVFVILLAFFGSYSFMSMALDREPPVIYEGARAISPSVESGGSIEVEFKVFRKRICSAVVRRWLTDATGVKHSIPSFTVGLELLAGRETYRRSITIPQAAAVGPASYQVIIDYTCNGLQTFIGAIRVASPPIAFNIMPSIDDPPVLKPDSDG